MRYLSRTRSATDDDDDDDARTTMTAPDKLQTLRGFKTSKILNDGKDSSSGNVVALLGTFPGSMMKRKIFVLKLSRPPIPLDNLDQLADAITLYERTPYSGMEYGYYRRR